MINEPKIKEKIAKIIEMQTIAYDGLQEEDAIDQIYQLFLPILEANDRPEYFLCRKALEQLNGD